MHTTPFKRRRLSAAVAGLVCFAALDAHASADLAVADGTAAAGRAAAVNFVVTRSGDTNFAVTVKYATADGTAKAGTDYTTASGTLTFNAGETSKTVAVAVTRKAVLRSKTFTLALSDATASSGLAYGGGGIVPVGYHTEGTAVADFNGDGKADFATVGASAAFGDNLVSTLHVLRNDTVDGGSSANFSEAYTQPAATFFARVAAADLNRDGKPDLYVPGFGGGDVVYINTTPAGATTFSFAPTGISANGVPNGYTACFGDFDGDGIVDVAVVNQGLGIVEVLRNTTPAGAAAPKLTRVAAPKVGSQPMGIVAADFNGDGKIDIATGDSGSNTVSVLINTTAAGGPITFAPAVATELAEGPTSLAVADFNGDGKPDLATANNQPAQLGQTFSVLFNTTPKGSGTPSFNVANAFGGAPYGVAAADVDGDGKPDVLIANLFADANANGALDVYLNKTASGSSTPAFQLAARRPSGDEPHWVVVGDWNRDGRPDLLGADAYSSNAGTEFGIKPVANPQVKIVDGSATGTITPRNP